MHLPLARITDCESRLQRDFAEFARLWTKVRENWLDDRCRKFEQDHLTTIGPSLGRFTAALHEFNDSLRKAETELMDASQR